MFIFLTKLKIWHLGIVVVIFALIACLSVGQAITFAWLSSFPEHASRLDTLRIKFWVYMVIGLVAFVLSGVGIVRIVKLTISKRNNKDDF